MKRRDDEAEDRGRDPDPDEPGPGRDARRPGAGGFGRLLPWLLLGGLFYFWGQLIFGEGEQGPTISYTRFRGHLEEGRLTEVEVQGPRIHGVLTAPDTLVRAAADTVVFTEFTTFLPSFGDDDLMAELDEQGVRVRTLPPEEGSPWLTIVLFALPVLLLLFLSWNAARRMRGGAGARLFGIGKADAKLYDKEEQEETTFRDVAGAREAKEELQEVIDYLRDPTRFERLGGEMPTGILLVGPPGTGKTLLARAVAGEADVPFFSITGSDFMEMFVGVGAKRVRDLFEQAKETAPAIVFIDELDSIGRQRGAGLGGGHDEREQTLNQLLSELDGFEPTENVIVMAATNRPDILDQALLRPGRFDRRVTVHLPSASDRADILRIHARDKPLAKDVDLEELARGTPGLSGADLENLVNEAALMAAQREADRISRDDFEQARDKVLMGLERQGIALTDEERRLLAYHEAGHAVVAAIVPHSDPIHKVSIIPRGRAMGVTQQLPEKERYIYEKEYLMDRATVMMGGRAAEELVLDTSTSGAEDDLREATKLARKMVLQWGMSDALGRMSPTGRREQVFLGEEIAQREEYSDETAREVDQAVQEVVESSYARALETLEEHRDVLDEVAAMLLEREEIGGAEVVALLEEDDPHEGDQDDA